MKRLVSLYGSLIPRGFLTHMGLFNIEVNTMTRRFEGFPTKHGLVVLDTYTGTTALHPFQA